MASPAAPPSARPFVTAVNLPPSHTATAHMPVDDDDDSDGPLSPEFAHTKIEMSTQSPDRDRVLRPWSPGTSARAAARRNKTVPDSASPGKMKRLRSEELRVADIATTKENDAELYDSSSDGDDGYARGTVFASDEEDNANEEDDLFITPRRPEAPTTRFSTDNPSAHDGEYATFDPILALLDDHWHILGLDESAADENDPSSDGGSASDEDFPVHLAPIAQHLRTLVMQGTPESVTAKPNARWRDELAEAERQLMEALRDADEVEASRERYARECHVYKGQASAREAKIQRLIRENETAAREINAITEAMATLTAAHDVDARINDLLIADQAEEIRELRKKLELERCRSQTTSENGSEIASRSVTPTTSRTGSPIASPSDSEGSIGKTRPRPNVSVKQAATEVTKKMRAHRSTGARKTGSRSEKSMPSGAKRGSENRAKEREVLLRKKESMFEAYEKRHSMTIQHVVRRTSQLSLVSRKSSTAPSAGTDDKHGATNP